MERRKRLTLQDVAQVAGVSVRTVSNVLNDFPHVRPETRARVQRAVDDLGYRINPTARNLRRGSTGMIGLVLPDLNQPYFAELAEVVLAHARERGFSVLIERTSTQDTDAETDELIGELSQLTDGLLLSPTQLSPSVRRVDSLGVPVVVMTERHFDTGVDHVTIHDAPAAHAATAALIADGRRRIAAIGADSSNPGSTAAARELGYRTALTEAGIPMEQTLLEQVAYWQSEGGYRAMELLLDRGAAPDAVFAFNDTLAIGVLAALADRGIRVPDDIAVIGFDDIGEAAYLRPALSTINPGRAQAARLAVDLLLARIEGERDGPGEVFLTDFHVVHRGTTRG